MGYHLNTEAIHERYQEDAEHDPSPLANLIQSMFLQLPNNFFQLQHAMVFHPLHSPPVVEFQSLANPE